MVFPKVDWERAEPEALGFDLDTLGAIDDLMKEARSNGVLIRNGYLVAEWTYGGPIEQMFEVQSITKSITSLVLGLAVDDGVIPSLDTPLFEVLPDLEAGKYTDQITARQFITCTSGMPGIERWSYIGLGNIPPGTEHHYFSDHFEAIARAVTYLYGREMADVLHERIISVINPGQDKVRWSDTGTVTTADGREVIVNAGYAFTWWNAKDLARVGHLYLNKGRWNGQQLLSEAYVAETFTAVPLPISPWREGQTVNPMTRYGLGWWGAKDMNLWFMSGNGGQQCFVLRDLGVVITKVNDYRLEPSFDSAPFRALFPKLMATPNREERGA